MSDRTSAARSPQSARQGFFANRANRMVVVIACVVAGACILVGGHFYGRYLSARDLGGRDDAIQQLRAENQKTKRQLDSKSAEATQLEVKLKSAQASLNALMPSANTYNIEPNQSLVVADGHLTVGLVGSPGNDSITLDINGKDQSLHAGQAIGVTPDAATDCQVQVQSFDMFKAVLVATCAGANKAAKPQ